jgi:chaperonin GroES
MPDKKHEHLIRPLIDGGIEIPQGEGFSYGPGNADKIVWLNGRDHLEGLDINFTWGFYSGIGDWHTGQDPHVHPYPECLVFVGLDSANLNYLGAEIEIYLGKEQEVYSFDEPTVVIIPGGLPHCPLITKRVFSPKGFGFFLASLGANPETTWMGEGTSEEAMKKMAEMAEKQGINLPMKSRVAKKKIKKNPTKATGKYAHLVKPLKSGITVKRGGIIIPDTAKEKPSEGKIVAVGKGKVLDNGEVQKLEVKKGDKILFGKYAGTEITIEGKEHLIMREDDIIAIVE